MKESVLSRQSPFVYFWLGVLTGALIVVGSLMVRSSMADEGSTSVLRGPAVQQQVVNPGTTRAIGTPGMKQAIGTPGMTQAIGTPGMKQSIGTPGMKQAIGTPGM
ncbi:MAG: hypothetical protein WC101_01955 [Candidatus Gracilibacteria bacterium]